MKGIPVFGIIILSLLLSCCPAVQAQDNGSHMVQSQLAPEPARLALEKELTLARQAGDEARYRAALGNYHQFEGSVKGIEDVSEAERPVIYFGSDHSGGNAPLWGGDVTVFSGNIAAWGQGNIAVAADTLGNIYAAFNNYTDTSAYFKGVHIRKSTDLGATWTEIIGFGHVAPRWIQSFAMTVTDTADGRWVIGLLYTVLDSSSAVGTCGDLWYFRVLDSGSQYRFRQIASQTTSTGYRNVALTSDGFFYSPANTMFYGAVERVTRTSGTSRGITAVSTPDGGYHWNVDTTVGAGGVWEDINPRIGYMKSPTGYDSVFIAVAENWPSPASYNVGVYYNRYSFSQTWVWKAFATSADDEFDPDIAISPLNQSIVVPYTRNQGNAGQYDLLFASSMDGLKTYAIDTIATVPGRSRTSVTANCVPRTGSSGWRIAFKAGSDSVMYVSTIGDPASLAHIGVYAQKVNDYMPTGTMRPMIGAHRVGEDYLGHVLYAGFGPENLYFDAFDLAVDVNRDVAVMPARYSLSQNYPNPFNPTTSIAYTVGGVSGQGSGFSLVHLAVYDVLGREVKVLVNERKGPGSYQVRFDGSQLASGMYIYRLQAAPESAGSAQHETILARKLLLLK